MRIDAVSGAVLTQRNLGAPVPTPLNCLNNGPNVGIDSTPVIDTGTNTMYLITYGLEDKVPVHREHALGHHDTRRPRAAGEGGCLARASKRIYVRGNILRTS